MNKLLFTGSLVVTVALVFYTIAAIREFRSHVLTSKLLLFFSLGLFFDFAATAFMIAGSQNSPFTLHGFIGYSALAAMAVEVFLLWRIYRTGCKNPHIPPRIHYYTMFAYTWWVLAFITGGLIAVFY